MVEPTRETPLDETTALIYCGLCGALNPATHHFCAACGTTLLDAFHGSEGLRVYERPDPAARLIEILPAGAELDLVTDDQAPLDFARIRLPRGRLGYVRLLDIGAITTAPIAGAERPPDINTNARGCVTPTGAMAALGLLLLTATLGLVMISRATPIDAGPLALTFCIVLAPLLILTGGLYVGSRAREDRLAE